MIRKKETKVSEPNKCDKVEEKPYIPDKQYTVCYHIGNDPQFFVAHGTDYKLATIDIQSIHTGEIYAHPVLFLVDDEKDTMDMIPFASVGVLKYNWGYKEESEKFITDLATLQKKAKQAQKKRKKDVEVPAKMSDAVATPENEYQHQYG